MAELTRPGGRFGPGESGRGLGKVLGTKGDRRERGGTERRQDAGRALTGKMVCLAAGSDERGGYEMQKEPSFRTLWSPKAASVNARGGLAGYKSPQLG